MDAKTLKALKGSIKKWEMIVAGKKADSAQSNCPLCVAFIDPRCSGCPVREKTGLVDCLGSPWRAWAHHKVNSHIDTFSLMGEYGKAVCSTCRKLARAELCFLKSLLPSGKHHENQKS